MLTARGTSYRPSRTGAREVQDDDPRLFVLKIRRCLIVLRGVDHESEIDRSLPTEVIMLVRSTRDVEVGAAEATRARTAEKQQMPVGREIGSIGGAADAVNDGHSIERIRLTGALQGALRLARCETQISSLLLKFIPLTPAGRVEEMYRLRPFFEIAGCVLRSVVLD
jgi:hypothetical protein